ncbi:MAG: hypothetical protein PHV70_13435, partial [Desulfobacteraceae bacterium]|nr:hypothetical protein [Desulfobacteraceae bacterium]
STGGMHFLLPHRILKLQNDETIDLVRLLADIRLDHFLDQLLAVVFQKFRLSQIDFRILAQHLAPGIQKAAFAGTQIRLAGQIGAVEIGKVFPGRHGGNASHHQSDQRQRDHHPFHGSPFR